MQAYSFECTGVFTNTTPTDAYRGAGRPEATYAIERAVDALARELEHGPGRAPAAQLHRRVPEATIASGLTDRLGRLQRPLDKALELLGLRATPPGAGASGASAATRSELGIGFSTYVEMCGLAPSRILGAIRYGAGGWDAATIRCLPTGTVQVVIGTSPHGQGHETTFAQIVADRLGVGYEDVEVLHGDTAVVAARHGHLRQPLASPSAASRSGTATAKIVDKAQLIAAHRLGVAEAELEFADGTLLRRWRLDRRMKEIALQAWTAHDLPDGMEPGLSRRPSTTRRTSAGRPGRTSRSSRSTPRPARSTSSLRRGRRRRRRSINPMIVDGQIHGGIAQGVAQALFEEAVYDDDGQPAHGLDGELPRPVRGRAALVRARPHRDGEPDEPARREGRGGDGHDRLASGRDERGHRRAVAVRHHRHRHARDARARLAGAPGGEVMIPAPFDYEVAESVESRDRAARLARGREAARGRAFADARCCGCAWRGRRCSSTSGA